MLAGPWIVFAAFVVGALLYALHNFDHIIVSMNGEFFYALDNSFIARFTAAFVAVNTLIAVVIEVLVYRHLKGQSTLEKQLGSNFVTRATWSLIVRTFIFTIFCLSAAV
ncbi:hypothetical protein FA15DRAFT_672783 [Coprinopsis marcescibilis]|uniref:Uncharacterized protein n=1 Tax=Coprinopsis marcescibilis TaxID=230819 RepID=A0A5C3KZ16_COPMA|nr:hypothetical protein FA15DRAFT_672783 [Coprinopsis marcescibilis]